MLKMLTKTCFNYYIKHVKIIVLDCNPKKYLTILKSSKWFESVLTLT